MAKKTPIDFVKVGPFVIHVNYKEMGENVYGQYQSVPPLITIKPGLDELQTATTIFHEALHAIENTYSVRLTEQTIRILETSITQLLQDNPALTEKLARKSGGNI